ncbi:helix-turn-helix domain-containing protein [candidate division WWE3 bacterium]|jgi:transcriptional regulator with XRE-family HTH domain|nr:helix-turn-helix domain-containing protein [candidate division WWE3 bacterium]
MGRDWRDRAKSIMRDKRITQADLATALGKSTRGAIGHYFTGRSEPDLEGFRVMANFLGVSLNYLLSGDTEILKIDSSKLQDCIKVVAKVVDQYDLDISEDQKAKLVAFLYAETPDNEEVSESKTLELTSFFTA